MWRVGVNKVETRTLSVEFIRKSIHLLVALVPAIARVDTGLAMGLLGAGTVFYVAAENARRAGVTVAFVSDMTLIAQRSRERGRFVLGPVTLGVGAMLALMLYPLEASSLAIFALAFGDGFASLVGRALRGPRIPLTVDKTLAGSAACFALVLAFALRSGAGLGPSVWVALGATVLEAYSPEDMDNILVPVGTGFIAARLLS